MIYGNRTHIKQQKKDILAYNKNDIEVSPKTFISLFEDNRFSKFLLYAQDHRIKTRFIYWPKMKKYLKQTTPDFKFLVDVADLCKILEYLYFYKNDSECNLYTVDTQTKNKRSFEVRHNSNISMLFELINPTDVIGYYGTEVNLDGIIKISVKRQTLNSSEYEILYSYEFVNNTFTIEDKGTEQAFSLIINTLMYRIKELLINTEKTMRVIKF